MTTLNNDKTQWFCNAKWGVFNHYLTTASTTADEWNRMVDSFNVKALAAQVASTGAGYYFITLGQGSGHYCCPNETYDKYVGQFPSKCSQRDLVSDLYDALQPYGIPLMAYVPADGSNADPIARIGMKMTAHWSDKDRIVDWNDASGPTWQQFRLPEFQHIWEEICADWSLRFGNKVRGWWVDGAYAPKERYPENEEPNYNSYKKALRAGNPDAIISFNTGVRVPVVTSSIYDDYTAGELTGDLPVGGFGFGDNPEWCNNGPIKPFVNQARYHVFNFLGPWWSASPPRFPTELIVGYTKYITSHGGVITWDVPVSTSGIIPEPFIEQLKAVGKAVKQTEL
ncbi:MAG: hypothetical protein WCO98_03310 [bacterium]